MGRILLFWNGMASRQLSGGDMFIGKFIKYGKKDIDLVLSDRARQILPKTGYGSLYVTDNKTAHSVAGLLCLYSIRLIKSVVYTISNRTYTEAVISSSPFLYDLIPSIATKADNRIVVLFHLLPDRKAVGIATKIRFALAATEQRIALRLIGKHFDTILVGNPELQRRIASMFPEKKIIVAHAGIDTKSIEMLADRTIKKDENTAVFVGRLTAQKGILDLVDIVKTIEDSHPTFRCFVIGDGPERQKLEEKIKKEKLSSIILKGFVDEKEKFELISQAKYFIFPSYEEGWGIALAEALYMGCIGVTYELGHYRSLFKSYPLYVPVGNTFMFSQSILEHYSGLAKKNQVEFMRRYDDKKVIADIMTSLGW